MFINWVFNEKWTEHKLTEGHLVILLSQTVYYCTLFKGKPHANVLSDTARLFVIQIENASLLSAAFSRRSDLCLAE